MDAWMDDWMAEGCRKARYPAIRTYRCHTALQQNWSEVEALSLSTAWAVSIKQVS